MLESLSWALGIGSPHWGTLRGTHVIWREHLLEQLWGAWPGAVGFCWYPVRLSVSRAPQPCRQRLSSPV